GGSGEIQTADIGVEHRNFQAAIPVRTQQIFGQSTRLAAKDETVVRLVFPIGVEAIGFGGEIDEACLREWLIERFEISMAREVYFRPVVETSASQRAIVHAKAGDADDVQWRVCRRTHARDVAGVRWNLWFDKCDGKHEPSIGPIGRMGPI